MQKPDEDILTEGYKLLYIFIGLGVFAFIANFLK
jgi:hypothetical protein